MARHEIPEGYTIGLLATMPRSGTWYSFYFFEFLDVYLSGRDVLNTRMDLEIYDSLKLGKINVHAICPGFAEHFDGPCRRAWDDLEFYVSGYNYGYDKFIGDNINVFSPVSNPAIRIIYLFRNPLDQAVSYFRHAQNNKNEQKRVRVGEDGEEREIADYRDFLRGPGLDSYIKQYVTFHEMNKLYPGNILMVPYERLMRNPAKMFRRMLNFWNFRIDCTDRMACFERALRSCERDSLKNVEAALGATLGRDQVGDNETHIRGGESGKWHHHFDDDDVEYARNRLAQFDINLGNFILQ